MSYLKTCRYRLANHVHGLPFDPPRWGEVPRLRLKSTMPHGLGTTVAVLDSGVISHPWLEGSYEEDPLPEDALERWDPGAPVLPRHVGHGTFVAGVVLQYAPSTTLVSRRVVDLRGDADEIRLTAALAELVEINPDVVNLSLSPAPVDEPSEVDEGVNRVVWALRWLQDTCGSVVVIAAGNRAEAFPAEHIPAEDPLTVVVGALDLSGQPAWFSSMEGVQIWAPGVDILSSFVYFNGSTSLMQPYESPYGAHAHGQGTGNGPTQRPVAPFAGWARWNGSSFAAPAVAGAIATEIGTLSSIEDLKERRRQGLEQVLGGARAFEVGDMKGLALNAWPVALQGPPVD
jgi:subtilisin family serine protease